MTTRSPTACRRCCVTRISACAPRRCCTCRARSGVDPLRRSRSSAISRISRSGPATAAFLAVAGPVAESRGGAADARGHGGESGGEAASRPGRGRARDRGRSREPALLDLLPPLIADEDLEVARQAMRAAHRDRARGARSRRSSLALGRPELADEAARRAGASRQRDRARSSAPRSATTTCRSKCGGSCRRCCVRIGTPQARAGARRRACSSRTAPPPPRHRVAQQAAGTCDPTCAIDPSVVELLLAAEIAGHYRSYQVLGPLRAQLKEDDPVLAGAAPLDGAGARADLPADGAAVSAGRAARCLRRRALVEPDRARQRARVPRQRARSRSCGRCSCRCSIRRSRVEERIELANRLVGAPLETAEQAVATLLASEDPWLRSCAIHAVGTLQLRGLAPELKRYEAASDPLVREGGRRRRGRGWPAIARAARAAASGARPNWTSAWERAEGQLPTRPASPCQSGSVPSCESECGRRRERPLVLARAHEPLDPQRQGRATRRPARRPDSVRARRSVNPMSASSVWPEPEPGARRLLDDRPAGTPSAARQRRTSLFRSVADRQQVDRAVAVLREVADRELAAVAGAGDQVVQRVRDEVQRRHPQPRLHVRQRQLRLRARSRRTAAAPGPVGRPS